MGGGIDRWLLITEDDGEVGIWVWIDEVGRFDMFGFWCLFYRWECMTSL